MAQKKQLTEEDLQARERSIAHGLVGIHIKPEQLRKLFELADAEGITPNALARRWILERLNENDE